MLAFFPFTGINEILPSLMGVLGLLMTWELHDLGVRAGRIQGLDISDPSVVRTLLRPAFFRRGERRLAAQYEVTRVLAKSSTIQDAGPSILKAIGESLDSELGIFWSVDEQLGVLRAVDHWHASNVQATEFVAGSTQRSLGRSIGLPGRVWASAAPAWTHNIVEDVDSPRGPFAAKAGLHGAFAFPVRSGAHIYGVIEFFSRAMREPDGDVLNMVDEIGIKIGQFLHREQTELTLRQTEEKLIEEAKLVEVARWSLTSAMI
jgi:two-component system, cell cycle sensor histidine kinase and response regulator CckA